MIRRISTLAVLTITLFAAYGAAGGPAGKDGGDKKAAKKPAYVHNVIFYLKNGAPQDEVEKLIHDSHAMLTKIPTVRGLWAGRPASAKKSTPKVAATDY